MKIDKVFIVRLMAVFVATLVTVGGIKALTGYYGYASMLTTFILAILVAQVFDELIDPRKKRETKSSILVMRKDIDDLKKDIKFLKYYLHKETGVDFGELQLESRIWKELGEDEQEQEG